MAFHQNEETWIRKILMSAFGIGHWRSVSRMLTASALGLLSFSAPSVASGQPSSRSPIVELRQYTLHPGKRDTLITLFEAEFVETQDALGMKIVATFRDLDAPDRFVWIRAFTDMTSRAEGLKAFYSGPVWKAHGKAAAATMIDASNVLLLRDARPGSGFNLTTQRLPKGATGVSETLIVANIYYFERAVDPSFVEFFDRAVRPQLTRASIPILATFVSETAPNTFPQLRVREQDRVFVWFSRFDGQLDYERRLAALSRIAEWKTTSAQLHAKLKAPPEVLHLQPTPRSQLRN